jgi:hypothetical protein
MFFAKCCLDKYLPNYSNEGNDSGDVLGAIDGDEYWLLTVLADPLLVFDETCLHLLLSGWFTLLE